MFDFSLAFFPALCYNIISIKNEIGDKTLKRKEIFDRNQHSVYLLYYHLILVVKYRRNVFDDAISERAKDIFFHIAPRYGITLEEWDYDMDHIHAMFRAKSATEISKFINAYKSASSRLLKKEYPQLDPEVMVRGAEVLNDATLEDAVYTGVNRIARVIPNGNGVAGTVYHMLSDEARAALDTADVILAKGQGNYESMCRQGRHVFYSFLCKCDLFVSRFEVPRLTGIFVEEQA